ncbi:hypothetical protein LCGC14_1560520 [marine sediment metagenome]|uniref:Uncharacterized protein n=1 Tax=marine sediment metagenome TaxID=412755 RepID=A0A0F9IMM3_9ZZZZ
MLEVTNKAVKPATVKKLRTDVDRAKQDAATDKLLSKVSQDAAIAKLQKQIKILDDRVSLLEQ